MKNPETFKWLIDINQPQNTSCIEIFFHMCNLHSRLLNISFFGFKNGQSQTSSHDDDEIKVMANFFNRILDEFPYALHYFDSETHEFCFIVTSDVDDDTWEVNPSKSWLNALQTIRSISNA
jgi:hypothetical protein